MNRTGGGLGQNSQEQSWGSWLTRHVIAAPFGRFRGVSDTSVCESYTLIGRHDQRAYVLDLLAQSQGRCSVLVTGRRGAGKSSFVDGVLQTYEDDVHGRATRRGAGRAILWDKAVLFFLAITGVVTALVLHELLLVSEGLLGVPGQHVAGWPSKYWIVVVPLGILCGLPILHAHRTFMAVWPDLPFPRIVMAILWLGLGMLAWHALPLGSPAVGASFLLLLVSGTLLVTRLVSYVDWQPTTASEPFEALIHTLGDPRGPRMDRQAWWTAAWLALWTLAWLTYAVSVTVAPSGTSSGSSSPSIMIWTNAALGLGFLSFAHLFEYIDAGSFVRAHRHLDVVSTPRSRADAEDTTEPRTPQTRWLDWTDGLSGAMASVSWFPAYLAIVAVVSTPLVDPAWITAGSCVCVFLGMGLWESGTLTRLVQRNFDPKLAASSPPQPVRDAMRYRAVWTAALAIALGALAAALGATRADSLVFASVMSVALILVTVRARQLLHSRVAWAREQSRAAVRDQTGNRPPQPSFSVFRPRPRVVLVLRGLIAFFVGVQLIHPLGRRIEHRLFDLLDLDSRTAAEVRAESASSAPHDPRQDTIDEANSPPAPADPDSPPVYRTPVSLRAVGGDIFATEERIRTNGRPADEILWATWMVLVAIILFRSEYEWVLRPFARLRADRAVDPLLNHPSPPRASATGTEPRAPEDFRRSLETHRAHYSRLARHTISFAVHRRWLPMTVVRVNLGLEDLDHARVVRAMLTGLRNVYREQFVSWTSGLANFLRLTGGVLVIAMTSLIAREYAPQAPHAAFVESTPHASAEVDDAADSNEVTAPEPRAPKETRPNPSILEAVSPLSPDRGDLIGSAA